MADEVAVPVREAAPSSTAPSIGKVDGQGAPAAPETAPEITYPSGLKLTIIVGGLLLSMFLVSRGMISRSWQPA